MCPLTSPLPFISIKKLFVSPFTVNVNIAEVPSIVAATTLLSLPEAPVILTVAFAASQFHLCRYLNRYYYLPI